MKHKKFILIILASVLVNMTSYLALIERKVNQLKNQNNVIIKKEAIPSSLTIELDNYRIRNHDEILHEIETQCSVSFSLCKSIDFLSDSYSSCNNVLGVYYITLSFINSDNNEQNVKITVIVKQSRETPPPHLDGYDIDEEYNDLPTTYVEVSNAKLYSLYELMDFAEEQGNFTFSQYIGVSIVKDTYSSTYYNPGVYSFDLVLENITNELFKIKLNVIVKQESPGYISSLPCESEDLFSLETITLTLENSKQYSLSNLCFLAENRGVFDFSKYLTINAIRDTYSASYNICGTYSITFILEDIASEYYELTMAIIVIQTNQNVDSSTDESTSSEYLSTNSSSSTIFPSTPVTTSSSTTSSDSLSSNVSSSSEFTSIVTSKDSTTTSSYSYNYASTSSSSSSSLSSSINYIKLSSITVTLTNDRMLCLFELCDYIESQGLFDFSSYLSLASSNDTYSSSSYNVGVYSLDIIMLDFLGDYYKMNVIIIVKQDRTYTSASIDSSYHSTTEYPEDEYDYFNPITVELYNDRMLSLFELYDYIESKGIFPFSNYLLVESIKDTYSSSNYNVGVYYVDVIMENIQAERSKMRINVIVKQPRNSYTPSTSSSTLIHDYLDVPSLPNITIELRKNKQYSEEEIFEYIEQNNIFTYSSYSLIEVDRNTYENFNNNVGLYDIVLFLTDQNNQSFKQTIFVIVSQDRSEDDFLSTYHSYDPSITYENLNTIELSFDIDEAPENIYDIYHYINNHKIYDFDDYLEVNLIKENYSLFAYEEGTYFIDLSLVNIQEENFKISIKINIINSAIKEAPPVINDNNENENKKGFLSSIFSKIKSFFSSIFNSIKNIFKK